MKTRNRTIDDLAAIDVALMQLRGARDRLRDASAHRAADYVARAMKSAQGARNHAERMTEESAA